MNKAFRASVPVLSLIFAFGVSAPLAAAAAPGDVVINEFSSNSSSDWAELYNTTGTVVDFSVTPWKIQDQTFSSGSTPSGTATSTISSGTLPANGFFAVNLTGLNQAGDVITLFDNSGNQIDQIVYGTVVGYTAVVAAPAAGQSAYRTTDGGATWALTSTPTKGATNVYPVTNTTTGAGYASIQAAIDAASDGNTITVAAGTYALDSQILIGKALRIVGAGDSTVITTGATPWVNTGESKGLAPIIEINAGNKAVILENVKVTGAKHIITSLVRDYGHGINVYNSSNVTLNNVTSVSNAGAGLIVNSSTVTANNLHTNGNKWHGINVDKNTTGDALFTLTGTGVIGESIQITSDKTTGATVSAEGYTAYKVADTTGTLWANRPIAGIAGYAVITSNGTSTPYARIQSAINAASTTVTDTVTIGAGTYAEQITLNKALTLIGAGDTTVIQSPNTLSSTFARTKSDGTVAQIKPVVTIDGVSANISNVKVDGAGKGNVNNSFVGIGFHNAGGSLDAVTVTGVRETPLSGSQHGDAILASNADGSARTLSITNSTVSDYQKNGMTLEGSGLTVTVSGNTVTGVGATPQIAQNGIQIGRGATGTVSNNKVDGDRCDAPSCGADWYHTEQATGILLSSVAGPFTVSGNTVSGSDIGIYSELASGNATILNNVVRNNRYFGILFEAGGARVTGGTVSGNGIGIFNPREHSSGAVAIGNVQITGNTTAGVQNDAFTLGLDARNNWWGSPTGPTFVSNPTGAGDRISTSTIAYAPWYIDSGRSALNTDVSGAGITIPSGNFAPSETTDGAVTLPAGTSDLSMSGGSVLDLSASANAVLGGQIVIAGATTTLSSYTNGSLSGANLSGAQTIGGTAVTVGMAVQLSSGTSTAPIVITNTALPNVSASIPSGTTILAPSGWTGTIAPPTTTTGSGNAPSGFSIGGTSIDVGSSDAVLLFDKPVTLTLTGVTGSIGYKPAGAASWTKIAAVCGGDYANPTAPSFPGECAISNGTDTKIVTYHFTTFGGLTPVAPTIAPNGAVVSGSASVTLSNPSGLPIRYTTDGSTPTCGSTLYAGTLSVNAGTALKAVSCDGGSASAVSSAYFSFPGGGGAYSAPAVTATPSTQTPSVGNTTPQETITPAEGKVLGASVYNFTRALAVGVRSDEVTELQKVLIAGGLLKLDAPTGYFGSLTRAAVIAFQKARGIAQTGTVGPLTRAELNKGAVATVPETTKASTSSITKDQANAIIGLLQAFDADASVIESVRRALGH